MTCLAQKGVFVFAELDFAAHKARKVVHELQGKGRELADKLKQELVTVVIGDNLKEIASTLISFGADRIITCEHELLRDYTTEGFTNVLSGVISEFKPSIVLFGATPNGRELAPRLAARLRLGLTADCTKLEIDPETKKVLWRHHEDEPMDGRAVCMKNGRIFVFRFGTYLTCLDAKTGDVLWRKSKDADPRLFQTLGEYLPRQSWQTNWRTTAYLKCSDKHY